MRRNLSKSVKKEDLFSGEPKSGHEDFQEKNDCRVFAVLLKEMLCRETEEIRLFDDFYNSNQKRHLERCLNLT
jgi:hypothetical protein